MPSVYIVSSQKAKYTVIHSQMFTEQLLSANQCARHGRSDGEQTKYGHCFHAA